MDWNWHTFRNCKFPQPESYILKIAQFLIINTLILKSEPLLQNFISNFQDRIINNGQFLYKLIHDLNSIILSCGRYSLKHNIICQELDSVRIAFYDFLQILCFLVQVIRWYRIAGNIYFT